MVTNAKLLSVDGELEDDELELAFIEKYPSAEHNMNRWFFEHPLHEDGQTWVLSKMWGIQTETTLDALLALAPERGFAYEPS